jgi:hypothetical protein
MASAHAVRASLGRCRDRNGESASAVCGRPAVRPPGGVQGGLRLPNPRIRQVPLSRREMLLLHARHSVEYSHPWARLSAALGKPIVHSRVFAFSQSLLCTTGQQSTRYSQTQLAIESPALRLGANNKQQVSGGDVLPMFG